MENKETVLKPEAGKSMMTEVSGSTGQVGSSKERLRGGLYRHPATGAEIFAIDDPVTGDAQARGYVRTGFEWVRDLEPGDVHYVGEPISETHAKKPEHAVEVQAQELLELRARLAALEASQAKAATDAAAPKTETELSQKHAQDAAEQQTEARLSEDSAASDSSVSDKLAKPADKKEAKK